MSVSIEAVVQRCSVRTGVLRNFAKFTGKQLCFISLALILHNLKRGPTRHRDLRVENSLGPSRLKPC